jgi:hypothetical protein
MPNWVLTRIQRMLLVNCESRGWIEAGTIANISISISNEIARIYSQSNSGFSPPSHPSIIQNDCAQPAGLLTMVVLRRRFANLWGAVRLHSS